MSNKRRNKNSKEKYLCSECWKEKVSHPDMLCETCYEKYVIEVFYPTSYEEEIENVKKDSDKLV
jgi:hypothetical protein